MKTRPTALHRNKPAETAHLPMPVSARVLLVLSAAGTAFYGVRLWITPGGYADLWFHMKAGEWILYHHRLPLGDIFSQAHQGREWIVNAWLSDILLRILFSLNGIAGLQLFQVIVSLAIFTAIGIFSYHFSRKPALSLLAAVLSLIGSYHRHSLRPEIFSMILLVLVLIIIYQYKFRKNDRLAWLVPTGIIWPNLHMGFISGFVVLVCMIAGDGAVSIYCARKSLPVPDGIISGRRLKRLVWITLLMAVSTLLNPYGPNAWTFIARLSSQFGSITEWMPLRAALHLDNVVTMGALGLLAVTGFLSLLLSKRPQDISGALLLVVFGLASWKYLRQTGQFCLVAPFVAATSFHGLQLPGILPFKDRHRMVLGSLGVFTLVFAALGLFYGYSLPKTGAFSFGLNNSECSQQAVDFIANNHLTGSRVYNSLSLGGWMIWNLWPDQKVYLDGRLDMYGLPALRQSDSMSQNQDIDIQYLYLTYPHAERFFHGGFRHQDWALVFFDDSGVIAVRRTPRNRKLIHNKEYMVLDPLSGSGSPDAETLVFTDRLTDELARLEKECPGSVRGDIAAGAALLVNSRPDEALTYLTRAEQKARNLEPGERAGIHELIALGLLETGSSDEAIRHLQTAIRLAESAEKGPGTLSSLHGILGFAYGESGQTDQALREFDAALELDSLNTRVRINRAQLLMALGKYAEAAAELERVHRSISSNPPDLCILSARCYAAMGKKDQALAELRSAIRVSPESVAPALAAPEFDWLRLDPAFKALSKN